MHTKLNKTFLSKRPSTSSFFIAVLSLLTLLLFFGFDQRDFSASGQLVFKKKEYWRAFTTTLLHADLNHLAHNAFFFTGLAALLHNYFGYWIFPVLSFFIGGLINFVALHFYPPEVHLVGVSGVIYFMATFWLTLYILIEKRQTLLVRLIHAVAVSLIFLFPQVFQPEVSYLAHGLGAIIGVPVGIIYYALNKHRIKAREEWIELKISRKEQEMEEIILSDPSFSHPEQPEDDGPSLPSSDSSQCQQH